MKNIFKNFLKNLNDEACKKNIKKKILLSIHPYYWLDDTSTKYWIIFFFTSAILQIKNK